MIKIDTTSSAAARTPASQPQPSDIRVCPFTVLYDQHEGHPWTFQGIAIGGKQLVVQRDKVHLKTGDYTMHGRGCESLFTIERKSADDVVGSVSAGHGRFMREHERMREMIGAGGAACVIVEGSLSAICGELNADGRWKIRNTLVGCVNSWPFRFGVPWFFAGDRRMAEELAITIMIKWWMRRAKESPEEIQKDLF